MTKRHNEARAIFNPGLLEMEGQRSIKLPMRALLVTSAVTFVPRNYDDFVCAMAESPHVGGLLVLENKSAPLAMKALWLAWYGAYGVSKALLGNMRGVSTRRRLEAFRLNGKDVWRAPSVNSTEALCLVKKERFDLIINARTRDIYKADILSAARLGCINVHHGLLPEQRGVMCDLWALFEGAPAGFTIHRMTKKIDAGPILRRVQVSEGIEHDYLAYLVRAARREAQEFKVLLEEIAGGLKLDEIPNSTSGKTPYRRNPEAKTLRQMIQSGMRL